MMEFGTLLPVSLKDIFSMNLTLLLIPAFIFLSMRLASYPWSMNNVLCLYVCPLSMKRLTSAESSLCFYRIETLQHNYFKWNQFNRYSNNISRTLCCCFLGYYKRCLHLIILICFLQLLFLINRIFNGMFL